MGPKDSLYGSRIRRRTNHGGHCQDVPEGTNFFRRNEILCLIASIEMRPQW